MIAWLVNLFSHSRVSHCNFKMKFNWFIDFIWTGQCSANGQLRTSAASSYSVKLICIHRMQKRKKNIQTKYKHTPREQHIWQIPINAYNILKYNSSWLGWTKTWQKHKERHCSLWIYICIYVWMYVCDQSLQGWVSYLPGKAETDKTYTHNSAKFRKKWLHNRSQTNVMRQKVPIHSSVPSCNLYVVK